MRKSTLIPIYVDTVYISSRVNYHGIHIKYIDVIKDMYGVVTVRIVGDTMKF